MFGLFGPPNIDKLKAKKNVQSLIKALNYQQDHVIRYNAAKALGEIGDARAVESLITVLKDEDESVRCYAAEALGEIGDARAVESLIITLKDRSSSTVRKYAAKALGQLQDSRAIEPLVLLLKDNGYFFEREAAAEALSLLGWQPKDNEQRALQAVALHQWEVVASLGAAAIEPLIAAISRTAKVNAAVRDKAFEILGEMTDSQAVEPLISALNFTGTGTPADLLNNGVRLAAARALGKMKDSQAVEPLIATLKNLGQNQPLKIEVTKALENFGVTVSFPLLSERPSDVDVMLAQRIWAKCPRRNQYSSDPILTCETDYCCVDMVVSHNWKGAIPRAPKCDNTEMIDFIGKFQHNQLYMIRHVLLDEILGR